MPIMSLQTGAKIAETGAFIIDPRELKVVAFYCGGPRLDVNPAILTVADIREIGALGIIVDSADVLVAPEDLVRLKEIIHFNFVLEDKPVVETSGRKLGHIVNYTLDSKSLYIIKLQVRPGMWQSFKTTELLIDRSQVDHVTDQEVVVRHAATTDEKKKQVASAPILDNPFRRAPVESAITHPHDESS